MARQPSKKKENHLTPVKLTAEQQKMLEDARKRRRKPLVTFDADRRELFLLMYRASGLVYKSAAFAGVCLQTVKNYWEKDPEYKQLCDDALQERLDELEEAVFTRAIDGVEEPVIGGKDRDTVVATVRKYSDSLATFLLAHKRPEFSNKLQIDANIRGGVFVMPSAPQTSEDWEQSMGEKAKGRTGRDD